MIHTGKKTSKFIKLYNKWFDIFNFSNIYGKYEDKNANSIDLEKQNAILHKMTDVMNKIRIGKELTIISKRNYC